MGQALTTAADRARAALVAFAKKVVDIAQKIRDCFIQKNHTLEVIIAHSAAAAYSEKVEAAKKAREHAKGRGKGKAEEAGRHKKGTKPEADQAKENAPSSEEGKQVIRKEDVQPPEESRDGADEESVRRALQLIVMPTVEEVRTIGGMPPVIFPTAEEVAAAKTRVRYEDGLFHFAITGVAGSGKSSLVNALLGRHNKHPDAAKTDVAESTSTIGRYPDPYFPFVWYDVPGAGTLSQPSWQYFNRQGLFVFDCIIVLFGERFTETDVAILTHCKGLQIPTYIVRSKADAHIDNIVKEMQAANDFDDDDDDDDDHDSDKAKQVSAQPEHLRALAREEFITKTRATVKSNLKDAGLPDQKVYIVSNNPLLTFVKKRKLMPEIIDEVELLYDLLGDAHVRRCVPDDT